MWPSHTRNANVKKGTLLKKLVLHNSTKLRNYNQFVYNINAI